MGAGPVNTGMNVNYNQINKIKPKQQENTAKSNTNAERTNVAMQGAMAEQATEEVRKRKNKKEVEGKEEVIKSKEKEKADKSEGPAENKPVEDEQEMIKDMKNTIKNSSGKVARKVNKSAYNYMANKREWFKEESREEAEEFFTIKIPKVMAKELSRILNKTLGLELEMTDDSQDDTA